MVDFIVMLLANPAVQGFIITAVSGLLLKINATWASRDRWEAITKIAVKVGLEVLVHGVNTTSAVAAAELIVDAVIQLVRDNPSIKDLRPGELDQLRVFVATFIRTNLAMRNGVVKGVLPTGTEPTSPKRLPPR